MMNRIRVLVCALALLPARAMHGSEPDDYTAPVEKEPRVGWYVGGAIGAFRFLPDTTASVTSNKAGGGFGTIGYLFQDNYGLELRFGGTSDRSSVQNLPGVPVDFPFKFGSVFGKFGTTRINRIQLYLVGGITAGTFTTRAGDSTETKGSISYGAGIDGNLGDAFSIGAELVRYFSAVEVGGVPDLNADGLSGSLRWHF